jgi:hypothetical protein
MQGGNFNKNKGDGSCRFFCAVLMLFCLTCFADTVKTTDAAKTTDTAEAQTP